MKVNEIAGLGNHNTALYWEYDTRLGRRWNVDPVVRPWESAYLVMGGNPILNNDVLGDEFKNGNTAKKDNAQKRLDIAKNNLESHKGDKDISKRALRKLQNAVGDAQSEYDLQLKYEKTTDEVINEFKTKSPDEFNKWNHWKDAYGKEIDVPITVQTDEIQMLDENGWPTGKYTSEGTTYKAATDKNGNRYIMSLNSRLRYHVKPGQAAVISITADLVHGLGHPNTFMLNGKTGENETEDAANQYERDVYNSGKGPKK